jgi:hypothetical protein
MLEQLCELDLAQPCDRCDTAISECLFVGETRGTGDITGTRQIVFAEENYLRSEFGKCNVGIGV